MDSIVVCGIYGQLGADTGPVSHRAHVCYNACGLFSMQLNVLYFYTELDLNWLGHAFLYI